MNIRSIKINLFLKSLKRDKYGLIKDSSIWKMVDINKDDKPNNRIVSGYLAYKLIRT